MDANDAFAIGNNITIAAGLNGSVGIGNAATVAAPSTGAFTLNGGNAAGVTPTSVVSVGAAGAERQITNVAAGVVSATSTDAVNGSQLFTTATALNNLGDSLETVTGGGLVINPNGTIATAPSITAAGASFATTTGAIQALNTANTITNNGLASALGGGASVAANGTVTAPSYTVGGSTYNDVASALGALDSGTLAQQTGGSPGAGQITIGAATQGTSVNFANSAGINRTLTGVAAGATTALSTDAVNGAQINLLSGSIATSIGGGSTYNPVTGTVTAPTVNVGGTAYTNLSAAIEAAGSGFNLTTSATGTGVANGTSISAIGAGGTHMLTAGNNIITTQSGNDVAIALNPALSGITSLAITGGPSINSTGIAMNGGGITGLANGAVNATSTDAVTGAQLFTSQNAVSGSTDALGASVAANLGGTAIYDPVTDTVNALSISAAGAAYNTVTGAIEALNTANSTANAGLASALGGGAGVAANGTVTAPSYALSGTTYTNVGDALAAIDRGKLGLVQQVGITPGAGQITVGAATGGTSLSVAGTAGDRTVTGVLVGAVTAASTDAVNGGQIFANNQQVATFLGGGAGVDPLTGALTAPSYSVGSSTLGNVGAALAALQTGAPVQYSTAGAPTTPNGLVPSQNMTLVGAAAGPVTLSNIGPAALTATSTDAVNGSQINLLANSNADIIGGGAAFDPLTGTLTAPTITVGGLGYNNIAEAIEAGDAKADAGLGDVANALGGGAVYDPATGGKLRLQAMLCQAQHMTMLAMRWLRLTAAKLALSSRLAEPLEQAHSQSARQQAAPRLAWQERTATA